MTTIQIKKNVKPVLDVGSALCDKPLHKKLDNYQLTSFMNNHTVNAFIGRSKSGKSSLLQGLFRSKNCLRGVFHNLYLVQPPTSRGSMKHDVFEKVSDDHYYPELTIENLEAIIADIETEPESNHCIIIDDCAAALKDKTLQKLFKQTIFNRRHMHISIYILSQTYYSIPREIRKLITNYIIFKVAKNELAEIFDENVETQIKNQNEISKLVFDAPFNFLGINVDTQTLLKNWDELIIPEL